MAHGQMMMTSWRQIKAQSDDDDDDDDDDDTIAHLQWPQFSRFRIQDGDKSSTSYRHCNYQRTGGETCPEGQKKTSAIERIATQGAKCLVTVGVHLLVRLGAHALECHFVEAQQNQLLLEPPDDGRACEARCAIFTGGHPIATLRDIDTDVIDLGKLVFRIDFLEDQCAVENELLRAQRQEAKLNPTEFVHLVSEGLELRSRWTFAKERRTCKELIVLPLPDLLVALLNVVRSSSSLLKRLRPELEKI